MPYNTSIPQKTQFKRAEWFELTPGITSIVRVLDNGDTAFSCETHYINKIYVKCLEEDCPICKNNRNLFLEYGKEAYKQPEFISKNLRISINVYDRTPAKVCPECGYENKNVSATSCGRCNKSIMAVQIAPINKVKILSRGRPLFDALNAIEKTFLDTEGNYADLRTFDLAITPGPNKNSVPTVLPIQNRNDVLNIKPEELFDLKETVVILTPDELLDLKNGVQLKDIFAARRASMPEEVEPLTSPATSEQLADVKNIVNDLFGGL